MNRLALALLLFTACGGDDDGGGDGGDGEDGDASPEADGGGGDVGPPEAAEGQFLALEAGFGESGQDYASASGAIIDPRPEFHRLDMEAGGCQLWVYQPVDCSPCDGLCDRNGDCVPFPTSLSAGTVTIATPGEDVLMPYTEYGYWPDAGVPEDLFGSGDPVSLAAAGAEVEAFSLDAEGVDPIAIDLVAGGETGDDTLWLVDGDDLVLTWDGAEAGAQVRLQIKSANQGHGMPLLAIIDCEAPDSGTLTVPRAMVEAFPEKEYTQICAGRDCPPSTLTRFTRARTSVGDREMELVVGFERQFIVAHD